MCESGSVNREVREGEWVAKSILSSKKQYEADRYKFFKTVDFINDQPVFEQIRAHEGARQDHHAATEIVPSGRY